MTCQSPHKIKYPSRAAAKAAIASLYRAGRGNPDYVAYGCDDGRHFHIGHNRKRFVKRIRRVLEPPRETRRRQRRPEGLPGTTEEDSMSTDILDRIDATIAAWEAAPESWVPGDPLYEQPGCVVRRMFDVIDDDVLARRPRCVPCGVSWAGEEACWMCGTERPMLGLLAFTAPISAVPVTFFGEAVRMHRIEALYAAYRRRRRSR